MFVVSMKSGLRFYNHVKTSPPFDELPVNPFHSKCPSQSSLVPVAGLVLLGTG